MIKENRILFRLGRGLVLEPAQVVTAVLMIIQSINTGDTICLTAFLSSLSLFQEAAAMSGGWGESL